MIFSKLYYSLKPFLPRRLQLTLRRALLNIQAQNAQDVWPINESACTPPPDWQGWPDGKKFALILTHDVETLKGLKKCRALAELDYDYGFRSSFNIVPYTYIVPTALRWFLMNKGFEVGVHDYNHDGKLYRSKKLFDQRAKEINRKLELWNASGFRSAAMHHNLEWIADLNISYDCSTFDTDPFEPQPDGVNTIFPFWYEQKESRKGFVEIPYTLPQDFTLFVLKKENDISIWKQKLDWIARKGGMATVIVHPDYINFNKTKKNGLDEYSCELYENFLDYINTEYKGKFWNPLPKELASFVIDGQKNQHASQDSCELQPA